MFNTIAWSVMVPVWTILWIEQYGLGAVLGFSTLFVLIGLLSRRPRLNR